MDDAEKLIILADACSDALLGGERGWERMDFRDFVSECRKAISYKNKLKYQLREQLNDCINFDGGRLTDFIMENSSKLLEED
jgi:hypothetical protein